jgi:glycosyltransferase involved in cell wall biosynthesis
MHGSEIPGLENILKLRDNKYFKGIMTLNEVIKQNLIKKGFPKEKIAVMENAVDLAKFNKITDDKKTIKKKLNIPLDKKVILYSGIIGSSRGLDTIMEAAKILDNKTYSFYFIGFGLEKLFKNWKSYKEKYESNTEIIFLGLKPKKLIPLYLKAADILLAIFSSNISTKEYMSPVKIIEYMASKTPFITTKIGRNIEICNNDECLFTNPDDPRDLSEKIELLIANEDLRKQLVKNAYQRAKSYSITKRCNKIIELVL